EELKKGETLTRPENNDGEAGENIREEEEKARKLYYALIKDLPSDTSEWNAEQKAKWLIAHQVEYYRRELKSAWWEFFRLQDLEPEEFLDERKAVFGLELNGTHPESKQVPIHSSAFPPQEISLAEGNELYEPKGDKIGTLFGISLENKI